MVPGMLSLWTPADPTVTAREATKQYLPGLLFDLPGGWTEQRKLEVSQLTWRRFVASWSIGGSVARRRARLPHWSCGRMETGHAT